MPHENVYFMERIASGVASCNNSHKAIQKRAKSLGGRGARKWDKRDTQLPHERFDLEEFVSRKAEAAVADGVVIKGGVAMRVDAAQQEKAAARPKDEEAPQLVLGEDALTSEQKQQLQEQGQAAKRKRAYLQRYTTSIQSTQCHTELSLISSAAPQFGQNRNTPRQQQGGSSLPVFQQPRMATAASSAVIVASALDSDGSQSASRKKKRKRKHEKHKKHKKHKKRKKAKKSDDGKSKSDKSIIEGKQKELKHSVVGNKQLI